jgi:hypothetical protein
VFLALNLVAMGEAQERRNWDLEFLINRHLLESPRPFTFSAALAMEDGRYPNVLFRDPDDNQLKLTHWITGDRVTG